MFYARLASWLLIIVSVILYIIFLGKKNYPKKLKNTSIILFVCWVFSLIPLYILSSIPQRQHLVKMIINTMLVVTGIICFMGISFITDFKKKIMSLKEMTRSEDIKMKVKQINKDLPDLNYSIAGLVLFILSLIWLAVIRN